MDVAHSLRANIYAGALFPLPHLPQNLVLSLLDAIVSSASPAPTRGPAAEHELVRLAISALFLWVPLTMRSGGALWAAASRDAALFVKLSRVLIALVSGSGAGAAAGRLCEKLQPAAVVAIYSLCSTMPSLSGSPAAGLEDKTPSGAPHPHGYILQLLLSHKPTLAAAGPQASAVFYGLTELLLRATVAGECAKAGPGRPLPTALRRALVDILAEIQVCVPRRDAVCMRCQALTSSAAGCSCGRDSGRYTRDCRKCTQGSPRQLRKQHRECRHASSCFSHGEARCE